MCLLSNIWGGKNGAPSCLIFFLIFFFIDSWATHSLILYSNLQNARYYLLKVYCDELIFSMAIFKFFIQNTIWQDFSFKVKQCQSYRTAMVFPHAEIDTLKLLYRFMNLSNSEPHSSPWLFFPLISHLHLGTPFWQWSSTVIWEMESSQNSQAHINFDYLFCLLFHIYQFHMRHMILSVYISKYTFFVIYLWKRIPFSENTHHIFGRSRILPIQRVLED